MTVHLLDHRGEPMRPSNYKKADPPKLGEAFGRWGGDDIQYRQLPGGSVVQFDLSKLTVHDFRAMRDNYQINASLSVLTFMLHQSDWSIECKDKKIAQHCQENLEEMWTQLNRGMGTALWAGYAPNVLQWENDVQSMKVDLKKVKDLVPEECEVNWKKVRGWAPPDKIAPQISIYDGIKQIGAPWPIPVENTFWYPMMMENGDFYGRKLLRSVFQSWYFSILLHLFANRYYERFGEPVPIGRAPFDDELDVGGKRIKGNIHMLQVLTQLRNRSVVVLPNDTTDMGDGKRQYDYDIEYLESQMRGADFERYMTRLDEEMSIGIFTPILLMRTADVGSYQLGQGHMQLYLWMLNAINDDRAQYINKFILGRMVDMNFSPNAPRAKIKFRKMGTNNAEMVKALIQELLRGGKAKVDLEELGQMAGLSLTEVKETLQDPNPNDPSTDPGSGGDPEGKGTKPDPRISRNNPTPSKKVKAANRKAIDEVLTQVFARVRPQIENAARSGTLDSQLVPSLGYIKKFSSAFDEGGKEAAASFYAFMEAWTPEAAAACSDLAPDEFMQMFMTVANNKVDDLLGV
jgi:hypothetical protein